MLEIRKHLPVTIDELKDIEKKADTFFTPDTKLHKQFMKIIKYHKSLIKENILNFSLIDEDSIDCKEKLNTKYSEFRTKLTKGGLELSGENLKNIRNSLNYVTDEILGITITSRYYIQKEKKLYLNDLYNVYYNHFCQDVFDNSHSINYIKIFDFYNDEEDKDKTIDYLTNQYNNPTTNDINFRIKLMKTLESEKLETKNIELITNLNTKKSFKTYRDAYLLHEDINIKYIPESTSENQYIPSLFYMLIRYRIKDSNKYNHHIIYLEPSTNWAVVTSVSGTGFSSQFYNLLVSRFDQQFAKRKITFNPTADQPTDDDFSKDIENIFNLIDNYMENPNQDDLDKNILNEINDLKSKYYKFDYGYKLLKSLYYLISYTKIINSVQFDSNKLDHTGMVAKHIINRDYLKTIKDNLIFAQSNIISFKHFSEEDLRIAVVKKIDNNKALCDIFKEVNWLNTTIETILNSIMNDSLQLKYFHKELGLNQNLSLEQMRNNFYQKLENNIKSTKEMS